MSEECAKCLMARGFKLETIPKVDAWNLKWR